ncbi:helix-turn-helix transcriptional regulator [Sphingobium sp. WCS2017Hpa-17]|uniref:helix-turn-helix transcriptional regulator n=1 Tax=Sphingobium sp. WCS2017Hpa-17 TaxID=3073638 RepID=UPI00288A2056|nr:helix-turn-helix transcriptional regulator [Sphingobium sp. WCS2017Hpa-17]
MQLTSADETDLLLPLYAGVHDQQEWSTFLERLRRRTGAIYASLIFTQGDMPIHLSKEVFAGRNLRAEARAVGLERIYDKDRLPYRSLRPGRVYQISELVSGDAEFRAFHETFNGEMGLTDERIVRIKEQEGTSAWLMLARDSDLFSAADGALMAAVAPHVAVALRGFVLTERQRVRGAASQEGLARAGVGWIALGRDARIIDYDRNLLPLLGHIHGSENILGERLHLDPPAAQRLSQAALDFARDANAPPRIAILRETPQIDALLIPMTERPEAALDVPVLLLFCRFSHAAVHDQRPFLRHIFGLSPREAELALALCDGRSLSEACSAMGLRSETIRSYAKSIYAKMGVRGQPELVRKIFLSSATLG